MRATGTQSGERLVLRTELAELARLSAWVEDVARGANLPSDLAFALQLCLEEAVANIVMYGGAPPDAPINIQIEPTANATVAIIEDCAFPFDPTQVPPRPKPASLEDTRIGGLGVHLIRHYSSAMRYERHQDRNRLLLTFARPAAPAEQD